MSTQAPEQQDVEQRVRRFEPAVLRSFLSWVAGAQARLTLDDVGKAIQHGISTALERALRAAPTWALDLFPVARSEGEHAAKELEDELRPLLPLSFDIHDPRFELAVEQAGARAIHEVSLETQRAVREIVSTAYRNGWHPYEFAPQIKQSVGLNDRLARAVTNFYRAQLEGGANARQALARTNRYAERLRNYRARMIARTETMRAANISRLEGYEQAARKGLFDTRTAVLEWMTHIDDRTCSYCLEMAGEQVPFGQEFPDGEPPVHPHCRCVIMLRFN